MCTTLSFDSTHLFLVREHCVHEEVAYYKNTLNKVYGITIEECHELCQSHRNCDNALFVTKGDIRCLLKSKKSEPTPNPRVYTIPKICSKNVFPHFWHCHIFEILFSFSSIFLEVYQFKLNAQIPKMHRHCFKIVNVTVMNLHGFTSPPQIPKIHQTPKRFQSILPHLKNIYFALFRNFSTFSIS